MHHKDIKEHNDGAHSHDHYEFFRSDLGGRYWTEMNRILELQLTQFGEISESQILQDHLTGRSRGFGFITFTSEETYDKVFAKSRFHELKGKLVEVKSATPRQQSKGYGGKGGKGRAKEEGRGAVWVVTQDGAVVRAELRPFPRRSSRT